MGALTLLERVVERLETEMTETGKSHQFAALRPAILVVPSQCRSHELPPNWVCLKNTHSGAPDAQAISQSPA